MSTTRARRLAEFEAAQIRLDPTRERICEERHIRSSNAATHVHATVGEVMEHTFLLCDTHADQAKHELPPEGVHTATVRI